MAFVVPEWVGDPTSTPTTSLFSVDGDTIIGFDTLEDGVRLRVFLDESVDGSLIFGITIKLSVDEYEKFLDTAVDDGLFESIRRNLTNRTSFVWSWDQRGVRLSSFYVRGDEVSDDDFWESLEKAVKNTVPDCENLTYDEILGRGDKDGEDDLRVTFGDLLN